MTLNLLNTVHEPTLPLASNFYRPDVGGLNASRTNYSERVKKNSEALFKPIQYMGAKRRVLPIILEKTLQMVKPNTYVLDIFSGSTIVSQLFNSNKLNVVSNDAMKFNSAFSNTLLNINREKDDLQNISSIVKKLENYQMTDVFMKHFGKVLSEEKSLLQKKNTSKLLELYFELPQVDKVISKESKTSAQISEIIKSVGQNAFGNTPLIANYYAGTYFSIRQALELDRLRNGIEDFICHGKISTWQYNFLLTCLLNVSSKIVYSAGKHFAQPIKQTNVLKAKVLHKRFYEDREKDVWMEFNSAVSTLQSVSAANFHSKKNVAYTLSMEEFVAKPNMLPNTSVIYADPPYTAQQYSRYYHIPEVIYDYKYPELQIVDGKTTTGLYPDNKFKSRFCAKRSVHSAFSDLFKLSVNLNSSLILSYSASFGAETGNSRMIELQELIDLGKSCMPSSKVEIAQFGFEYRQLNKSKNVVTAKDDKEILIVFKNTQK